MNLCWIFVLCCFWILDLCYGGQMKTTPSIKYQTKQNNDITIKILVHIDQPLTKKLAAQLKSNTRKKLKAITNEILEDARKLFSHTSLNQTVKFKLIDTRFLRSRGVALNDNAPEYLQSYCDWQSTKKISRKTQYYSVLFTGLDLFHVSNGMKVKSSSGRGYTRGICNARKSCAIIEWDPKLVGFLLAHEIGHSLGMRHDGPPYNQCNGKKNIMTIKYDRYNHPKTWSPCSWYSLKQFLKTSKSLCVRSESNKITFKSNL